MKFIIRKLNRKNLINNFLKIIKITKIGNWGFKHFYANLPSKWEKSILAIDPNKKDLIGYAIVSKKKQSTHIHLRMINEKYKRHKIGTEILNIIYSETDKNLTVKTYTYLRNTIMFYKRNSFKVINSNIKTTSMIRRKITNI